MTENTTVAERTPGERDVPAGVERGFADLRAGRLVDHEAAMDELDEAIEQATRERD